MTPLTKVKKNCRICGKEYTPCSYCENDKMAFHYRTICCSRECASIYLAKVLEARNPSKNENANEDENVIETKNVASDETEQNTEEGFEFENKNDKQARRKYVKKKQSESV